MAPEEVCPLISRGMCTCTHTLTHTHTVLMQSNVRRLTGGESCQAWQMVSKAAESLSPSPGSLQRTMEGGAPVADS